MGPGFTISIQSDLCVIPTLRFIRDFGLSIFGFARTHLYRRTGRTDRQTDRQTSKAERSPPRLKNCPVRSWSEDKQKTEKEERKRERDRQTDRQREREREKRKN